MNTNHLVIKEVIKEEGTGVPGDRSASKTNAYLRSSGGHTDSYLSDA